MGDTSTNFEIDDPGGGARIAGVAGSPGAAADTVLTSDGTGGTSWASGGGSQGLADVLATGNDGDGLQIKNLAAGTDPADAATVSQLGGSPTVITNIAVASGDDSEVVASPPSGAATVDGYPVQTGDRVLLASQDTATDNGVWIANTTGDWTRPTDWTGPIQAGVLVSVGSADGTNLVGTLWLLQSAITVGADSAAFFLLAAPQSLAIQPLPAGAKPAAFFNATRLGFFGVGPNVQPVVPLTTPSAQDVIDALVTLGLIAQSD